MHFTLLILILASTAIADTLDVKLFCYQDAQRVTGWDNLSSATLCQDVTAEGQITNKTDCYFEARKLYGPGLAAATLCTYATGFASTEHLIHCAYSIRSSLAPVDGATLCSKVTTDLESYQKIDCFLRARNHTSGNNTAAVLLCQ